MTEQRLAGRCVACKWLPWSKWCEFCKERRWSKRCGMAPFIRNHENDDMLKEEWLALKVEEEEEAAEAERCGGRRRRSSRSATAAALAKQLAVLAAPETIDEHASEKQATRADSIAAKQSSGSWQWGRKLAAKRAANDAAASSPERDAYVLQLEAENQAAKEELQAVMAARDSARAMLLQRDEEAGELKEQVASEHAKLLKTRRLVRCAKKLLIWHRQRSSKAAAGWTKNEGQVTGLRQLLAEREREQKEDQAEIKKLRAQLDADGVAASKFRQIKRLRREGGRGRKYADWFFFDALAMITHCPSPQTIRKLLRIFQRRWLPFFDYDEFEIPHVDWFRGLRYQLRTTTMALNSMVIGAAEHVYQQGDDETKIGRRSTHSVWAAVSAPESEGGVRRVPMACAKLLVGGTAEDCSMALQGV